MSNSKEELIKVGTDYILKGFSVIPVKGKVSCLETWKEYQSRIPTVEEFTNMINGCDPTGVAIITGKVSNLTVIDIDSKETAEKYNLPKTPTVKTAKGFHYYYRYQEDVRTSAGVLEKVDIRSEGGYIVAPPSLHTSGINYEWLYDLNTEFAEFPKHLFKEKIEPKNETNNRGKLEEGIKEGERHNQICKLIGYNLFYFPEKLWDGFVWSSIQAINKTFSPPLEYKELKDTFEDLKRRQSRQKQQNNKTESNEIKILSLKELFETTDEKVKFVVDKLIPEGINVISGQPGTCKSWVMLSMVKAIASGEQLFGRYDTIKGNVLIVDGESGGGELKRRIKMLGISEGSSIHIVTRQEIKIDNEKIVSSLLEKAKQLEIKIIFFDPLSSFHTKVENNSEEMLQVLGSLQRFLDQGITVVFLHHHRKDYGQTTITSQSMRGSSAIWGRVDSHLIVSKSNKAKASLEIIQIDQTKLRNGKQEKSFELHMEESENGMEIKYAGETEEESKGKVQVAMNVISGTLQTEGRTKRELQSQLEEDFDIRGRTTSTALSILVKNNVIKPSRKGKEMFYELQEVSADGAAVIYKLKENSQNGETMTFKSNEDSQDEETLAIM